ncbi:MAG: hypothetical protein QXF17_05635 [Ignisphaera sp.]
MLILSFTVPSVLMVLQTFAILSPHIASSLTMLAPLLVGIITTLIPLTFIALFIGVITRLV